MKTKKQAAIELQPIYNSMEVRKNTIATLMRKLWFDGENWRCNEQWKQAIKIKSLCWNPITG